MAASDVGESVQAAEEALAQPVSTLTGELTAYPVSDSEFRGETSLIALAEEEGCVAGGRSIGK